MPSRTLWRRVAWAMAAFVMVVAVALGGILAFDAPHHPPPLDSVDAPFKAVDFSDLPKRSHFVARDGVALAYRRYGGGATRVAILVHGSSGSSSGMHAVAKALVGAGATVFSLDMRGHGASGPHGDIAYIGQYEDDLEDFLKIVHQEFAAPETTLIGFSSGGGFVLRIAGGRLGGQFDRYMLLAPYLRYDAPNARPSAGGWTDVAIPRLLALQILNRIGIDQLDFLPVIAFAVPAGNPYRQTDIYSYRLLVNFQPDPDYLGDLARTRKPIMVVAGEQDEVFRSDHLAEALRPAKPDIRVDLVGGVGHIGLTTEPKATAKIAADWAERF